MPAAALRWSAAWLERRTWRSNGRESERERERELTRLLSIPIRETNKLRSRSQKPMHAHCATRTNRKWQTRGCNRAILKMHLGQVCTHRAVVTAPVMHAAEYFVARSHRVFRFCGQWCCWCLRCRCKSQDIALICSKSISWCISRWRHIFRILASRLL